MKDRKIISWLVGCWLLLLTNQVKAPVNPLETEPFLDALLTFRAEKNIQGPFALRFGEKYFKSRHRTLEVVLFYSRFSHEIMLNALLVAQGHASDSKYDTYDDCIKLLNRRYEWFKRDLSSIKSSDPAQVEILYVSAVQSYVQGLLEIVGKLNYEEQGSLAQLYQAMQGIVAENQSLNGGKGYLKFEYLQEKKEVVGLAVPEEALVDPAVRSKKTEPFNLIDRRYAKKRLSEVKEDSPLLEKSAKLHLVLERKKRNWVFVQAVAAFVFSVYIIKTAWSSVAIRL